MLLLHSLDDMSDEQVQVLLRQAFISVEKGFFQSIDDALAEKTELQLQIPEVRPIPYAVLLMYQTSKRAAYETAAAPVSHNAANPGE